MTSPADGPAPAAPAQAPTRFRESHLVGGIFFLALAVRLLLNVDAVAVPLRIYRTPYMDSWEYENQALNLLRGNGIGSEPGDAYYMPFFSLYVASVYFVFGHSWLALSLLNALVSSAGCVCLYLLGRDEGSRCAGFVASLLAVFWVPHLRLVPQVLTETPTLALTTLVTWWLRRTCAAPSWRRQAALGAALGVLLLFRAQMVGYAAAALLVVATATAPAPAGGGWGARQRLRAACVATLALALVMSPWWIRNWLALDAFVPLSLQGGVNMALTNTPESKDGLYHPAGDPDARETELLERLRGELRGKPRLEQARLGLRKTVGFVSTHPLVFLKFAVYRTLAALDLLPLDYFNARVSWGRVVHRCAHVLLLLLALAGLALPPMAPRGALWPVVLFAGFLAPLSLTTINEGRILFPVQPLLLLLAAYAVAALLKRRGALEGLERLPSLSAPSARGMLRGVLSLTVLLALLRLGYGARHERMLLEPPAGARRLDLPCADPEGPLLADFDAARDSAHPRVRLRARVTACPAVPQEALSGRTPAEAGLPGVAFQERFVVAYCEAPAPTGEGGDRRPFSLCLRGADLPPDLREDESVLVSGCVLAWDGGAWVQAERVERVQ
ncbi:MAG: glycosyltransferase family 39 protein [Planctomycetes bacterium]|nr:glycosyltransferase family 39 protein [Planctomycetota bacterium]